MACISLPWCRVQHVHINTYAVPLAPLGKAVCVLTYRAAAAGHAGAHFSCALPVGNAYARTIRCCFWEQVAGCLPSLPQVCDAVQPSWATRCRSVLPL